MSAWGHEIRLLTDDELAGTDPYAWERPSWMGDGTDGVAGKSWEETAIEWAASRRRCSLGRGCPEPAELVATYHYITGRRGRTSWAERWACTGHAERFAEKHGLELPARGGSSTRA